MDNSKLTLTGTTPGSRTINNYIQIDTLEIKTDDATIVGYTFDEGVITFTGVKNGTTNVNFTGKNVVNPVVLPIEVTGIE